MLAGNSEATSCIVSALNKLLDSYPYKNKSDVLCPSEIISSLTSKTDIHIMSDMQTNHNYLCRFITQSRQTTRCTGVLDSFDKLHSRSDAT